MATIGLSTSEPAPPHADFAIYIDFEKDAERPQRIFQAMDGLISAFQRLDRVFASSISSSIEPVLMLEDIQTGSLKVWMKDKLTLADDQAILTLDWKPLVGKYLVAAKYAFVRWVNDEEERARPGSLAELRRHFLTLARETDVHRIAAYGVPSATEILASAGDVATALSRLTDKDKAEFISDQGTASFNMEIDWGSLDLESLAVREEITMPPSPMILAVRRPDYLGEAQWEFRWGKRTIRAKIIDQDWLRRFQSRSVDVRPGDALRCIAVQQVRYGYDNEVISETFTVQVVESVLEDQYRQDDLFDPGER